MKLQVFSLRFDSEQGQFDDQPMQEFFKTHTAISISDHIVMVDGFPFLVILITYREKADSIRTIPPNVREEVVVADADKPLFMALRKWRNDRAKRDGRPSYVIFTNVQLASIAQARPKDNSALEALSGVGEARVRDYGTDVLALIQSHSAVPEGNANG